MSSRASRLRFAALLAAGALSVHELRYALTVGGADDAGASGAGHAYLTVLAPVVAVLAGLAAVNVLFRLASRSCAEPPGPPLARVWTVATLALSGAYSIQEWTEGVLASGHPAGAAGIIGHGGWMAFALAIAVGALIALATRGAAAASRRSSASRWLATPPTVAAAVAPRTWRPRLDALARHLAGRGPPQASV